MARPADNLLDRDAFSGQLKDRRVGLFPPQVALVLEPLGGSEELGVDRRRTHRAADLPHRFAHGIEESTAGVFHQMPSIGDLGCLRQRLGNGQAVTAAAIASDDRDLLLPLQPGFSGRRLAVWQQSDCLAPFEVADDGPIALVAPPRPVVDADHRRWNCAWRAATPDSPEQGVIAHR